MRASPWEMVNFDMVQLVIQMSEMKTNEEMDGDMSGDEAVDSLSLLIARARSIRKRVEDLSA